MGTYLSKVVGYLYVFCFGSNGDVFFTKRKCPYLASIFSKKVAFRSHNLFCGSIFNFVQKGVGLAQGMKKWLLHIRAKMAGRSFANP